MLTCSWSEQVHKTNVSVRDTVTPCEFLSRDSRETKLMHELLASHFCCDSRLDLTIDEDGAYRFFSSEENTVASLSVGVGGLLFMGRARLSTRRNQVAKFDWSRDEGCERTVG